MKKYFKFLTLVVACVLVIGCSSKNEASITKTCTLTTNDVVNGYRLDSEYKVYGKGSVVDKVETIETVTSDSEDILNYFEETLKSTYSATNEVYGGYTNEVTKENGKLVSKTTIDYNKMDLKAFVKDNSAMKSYVNKDNKILVEGITKLYESLGATCN